MKFIFITLPLAILLVVCSGFPANYVSLPQSAATKQEKIDALNNAYKNGLLTRAEYDAKLRAINGDTAPRAPLKNRLRILAPQEPSPSSTPCSAWWLTPWKFPPVGILKVLSCKGPGAKSNIRAWFIAPTVRTCATAFS